MREYILSIWNFLDPIYFKFSRLNYLSKIDSSNIFRVRLTKYKGKKVSLSDGTEINKNDTLIKIHLHNVRLLKELKDVKSEFKKAKMIYRSVQSSLPSIELFIRNHNKAKEIKGIIGITGLNRGCQKLGFEVIQISNPFYKWYKWTCSLPITLLSRDIPFKKDIIYFQPSYLLMSKDKLSSLYKLNKTGYE